MKKLMVLCFALLPLTSASAGTAEKATLQAAMHKHIDSQLVDGAVLDLDLKTGEVDKLYPTRAHPMIMTMGDNFVLCITLSDKEGNESLADYYFAPKDDEFVIIRTEINNRKALEELVRAGVAKRLK